MVAVGRGFAVFVGFTVFVTVAVLVGLTVFVTVTVRVGYTVFVAVPVFATMAVLVLGGVTVAGGRGVLVAVRTAVVVATPVG
jgi:hypothetical protein